MDAAGNPSPLSDPLVATTQSVSAPMTISVQVEADDDDAEENLSNGSVSLGSSDLELIQDSSKVQAVGMRFQNVTIPQDATVQSADIQFTVDETDSGPISLEIRGQTGQALAFTSSSNDVTNRPTTGELMMWSPPDWTTVGASGDDQKTPDLKDVVQEIVSGNGWAEGSAMAFVIRGSGSRTAESHNGVSASAPILSVTYVVSIGPAPPDAPSLLSPADGATGVSLTPILSWDGVADTFEFQVSTDPLFTTTVHSDTVVTTSAAVPPGELSNGTLYYWRVRGTNSVGTGSFSTAFSFTTMAAPDNDPPSSPKI